MGAKEDFMSTCIPKYINHGKSQDQAVAICMNEWENPKAEKLEEEGLPTADKAKSKLEILNDIKKIMKKNNYDCSDDILLGLFEKMTVSKELTKLSTVKLEWSMNDANLQEIKVFPKKKVFIEKLNDYLDLNDSMFDEMIDNFNNPKLFKPYMDCDHDLKEKYADIIDLYKKDDGLYAKIKLNSLGLTAIKENQYSYISPEWGSRIDTDKTEHNNVLWAITLTNIPALEGENPTLQEQIKLSKGDKMDIKEKTIALNTKLADMPAEDPTAMKGMMDEIMSVLKELLMKYEEAMGSKQEAEDQAAASKAELEKIAVEKLDNEAKAFLEENVKAGKILNVDEDYQNFIIDSYKKDPEGMKNKYLSKKAVESKKLSSSAPSINDGLSDEDVKIMEERGLERSNPKHVELYKKYN